ncbi:uncharacterized protein PRCAT00003946001 [Priceomyces carsonii]|uniref:uncharacterized protein n=1 Tax=Priceomyces carsonii TaxID=28549 RepID=UPI002EDA687C|nr:unnamed protein product [Priceomyces carsonii]
MFNLKRKNSEKPDNSKKSKKNAFDYGSSSEEECNRESKFLKSIKDRSHKVSTEVANHDPTEQLQKAIDKIDYVSEPKYEDKETELKYLKTFVNSTQRRRNERLAAQYMSQESKAKQDVEVFESDTYKKEKKKVLSLQQKEDEEEPNDNSSFFSHLISTRLGETVTSSDNQVETIPTPKSIELTDVRKTAKAIRRHDYEYQAHPTEEEETEVDIMAERLKNFLKCTVSVDDLKGYRERYWSRMI